MKSKLGKLTKKAMVILAMVCAVMMIMPTVSAGTVGGIRFQDYRTNLGSQTYNIKPIESTSSVKPLEKIKTSKLEGAHPWSIPQMDTTMEDLKPVWNNLKPITQQSNTFRVPAVNAGPMDGMGYYEQQIGNWEIEQDVELSNGYISELKNENSFYNFYKGQLNDVGQWATTQVLSLPLQNSPEALTTFNTVNTVSGTVISGAKLGMDTIWRTGKATQMISPPTYPTTKTSWGRYGNGYYPIQSGDVVRWTEEVNTEGPNTKRLHTDTITTPSGIFHQRTQTITPANDLDKFWTYNFPTTSFDSEKTTVIKHSSYHTSNFNSHSNFNSYPRYQQPSISSPSSFNSFP